MAHRRWEVVLYASLLPSTVGQTYLMRCRRAPHFIGDGKEARPSCRRLAWPQHPSELTRRRGAMLAGYCAGAVVEPS